MAELLNSLEDNPFENWRGHARFAVLVGILFGGLSLILGLQMWTGPGLQTVPAAIAAASLAIGLVAAAYRHMAPNPLIINATPLSTRDSARVSELLAAEGAIKAFEEIAEQEGASNYLNVADQVARSLCSAARNRTRQARI